MDREAEEIDYRAKLHGLLTLSSSEAGARGRKNYKLTPSPPLGEIRGEGARRAGEGLKTAAITTLFHQPGDFTSKT